MITSFQILFTVGIDHSYYAGKCRDFDFIVPGDTAKSLRGGRLLARVKDGELMVLFEKNETGDPAISYAGKTLQFWLKLLNPYFTNFTEPAKAPLFYTNSPKPSQLAQIVDRHPKVEWERKEAELEELTIEQQKKSGGPQKKKTAELEEQRAKLGRELADLRREITELNRDSVFAIVEIKISQDFYAKGIDFRITFEARKEELSYYIHAHKYSAADLDLLKITDHDFALDDRPQITFTKKNLPDIPPELPGLSATRVVVFKSDAVTRRQRVRSKIQLKKNGEVLIDQLSRPAANQTSAQMFIQISKS